MLKSQQAKLIDGVADYLDFLKENKQPINIATVSPKVNVDFFFDLFHLEQWFDYDKVVYNDGTLKSKPEPDFYVQAALNLNASPDQMIVFEDSSLGLQGAHNAQAEHIIAMATDDNHEKLLQTGLIDFVIDDFTDPRIKNIIDFYDE
ncbi:hypothetical protein GCM10025857_66930 [Alicyclobacillus contaminans]|nr:hypothetical protein GCM10025857_66930 [Alicyclobacillus contaminans]